MKIIILGAGQVGASLAQNLVKEASDITVVDTDPEKAPGASGSIRYSNDLRSSLASTRA